METYLFVKWCPIAESHLRGQDRSLVYQRQDTQEDKILNREVVSLGITEYSWCHLRIAAENCLHSCHFKGRPAFWRKAAVVPRGFPCQ